MWFAVPSPGGIPGRAAAAPAGRADLAVMTGNVAQVFLAEEDWAQVLRAIGTALRPGGYLVFETRRPERRAWEEWAADTSPVTLHVPGAGPVEHRSEVTAVDLPFVSFRDAYTFGADGAVIGLLAPPPPRAVAANGQHPPVGR